MAGLLQVFVLPAAAEPDGAQLLAMVDYSAVVETMAQACEQSRPELAAAFVAAQKAWWRRNGRIEEKLLRFRARSASRGQPRSCGTTKAWQRLFAVSSKACGIRATPPSRLTAKRSSTN